MPRILWINCDSLIAVFDLTLHILPRYGMKQPDGLCEFLDEFADRRSSDAAPLVADRFR
jgi:hypothetical protein